MSVLAVVFVILGLISLGLSFWYLLRWAFTKNDRKAHFRKRFFVTAALFIVAIIGGGLIASKEMEKEALAAGFSNSDEYLAAQREDITDPEIWAEISEQRKIKANAEKAEKAALEEANAKQAEIEAIEAEAELQAQADAEEANERNRVAKENEECRKDLGCWGEKANVVAMIMCPRLVERMARYDYEWTDGFLDVKFSHYRWRDIENGIVTVIGDKIKFQNGFGAWSYMIYECDIDPSTDEVLDVRINEGRI